MQLEALKAGVSSVAFWELTPREMRQVFRAADWRREQEADRDVRLAWYVAVLSHAKRVPSLKRLLKKTEADPKPLTEAERAVRQYEMDELKARMIDGRKKRKAGHSADSDPRDPGQAR